jgi:hypothetical protein
MNIEQAKIICLEHVEYVLNGTKNDYKPYQIGIAIDVIAEQILDINFMNYYVLEMYNFWRRGNLENYPKNSIYNMEILKESVNLL